MLDAANSPLFEGVALFGLPAEGEAPMTQHQFRMHMVYRQAMAAGGSAGCVSNVTSRSSTGAAARPNRRNGYNRKPLRLWACNRPFASKADPRGEPPYGGWPRDQLFSYTEPKYGADLGETELEVPRRYRHLIHGWDVDEDPSIDKYSHGRAKLVEYAHQDGDQGSISK